MPTKRYDKAYFDRWYRGAARVNSNAEVRRKVALAVSAAEYFLRRPLHSVLDVGCGEGAWFPHLAALRPKASYLGLDASDYAAKRFGRTRNIHQVAFGDLDAAKLSQTFDLVVCADAMHYIPEPELDRGLPQLAKAAHGVLFLEVLTSDDEIIGDLDGLIRRPAAWYRQRFAVQGMLQAGPYIWISHALRETVAALEVC